MAHLVKEMGFFEIDVEGEQPYLRHYHVEHPGLDVYMFFNEHPYQYVKTNVRIPARGRALLYDAFSNQVSEANGVEAHDGMRLALQR